MRSGVIFDIEHGSFVDGPGIRTTVFFKGCNLKCAWCHNPESQSFKPQLLFYRDKCTGCGKCREVCPNQLEHCDLCGKCTIYCPVNARKLCGESWDVEQLLGEILQDKEFFENTDGGVTFSGGECMLQPEFLGEILRKCKENGIHTAVDTAGNVPWSSFERILPDTDLFLYDVKCFDDARHRDCTGVGNRLILENLGKLLELGQNVLIRIPVIPGINDRVEEMEAIRAFLNSHGKPVGVELLPYHQLGENKYAALGLPVTEFQIPSRETMEQLKAYF